MTAQTIARPRALVTGASGGIGLELARQAAAAGHDLVLTARSEDRLAALAADLTWRHGVQAQVVPLDLEATGAVDRLLEAVGDAPIDVLVNNAGYATYGPFVEIEAGRDLAMLHLNVVVLTALAKRICPAWSCAAADGC
jgi:short-subunit dehydrogenase